MKAEQRGGPPFFHAYTVQEQQSARLAGVLPGWPEELRKPGLILDKKKGLLKRRENKARLLRQNFKQGPEKPLTHIFDEIVTDSKAYAHSHQ